jgi:hypothetical protein
MIIQRGRRLGRQLHEGLANMPILKALALSTRLGTTASRVMWADLAKIPAILTLEHLRLAIFDSDLDDYTRFILKHSKTLNILATSRMGLHSGTLADLSIFYAELSKAPRLGRLQHSKRQCAMPANASTGTRNALPVLPAHASPRLDPSNAQDSRLRQPR